MTHHKRHRKKRGLALLLTGALLFGNVPVYADQNAEIEFSSSDSDENKERTSGTDDTELTIEDTEEELSPDEADPDASAEDTSDPATFSSGEKEATFSSGEDDSDSDEDRDYILGRPMTEEEREAQLAPIRNLTEMPSSPEVDSDLGIATYAALPSKYDSRDNNIISSVKDQGSTSLCWAFSLASNMETSLLSRGLGSFDLSEEHLAYFWSHRVNDPLENTPNDYITRTTSDYHGSGNGRIASFFLSTWSGMATESKFPLQTSAKNYNPHMAYDTSAYMEDAVFSEYDVARTKQLIMEYGSVSVMIYMTNTYYCADTAAYSTPLAPGLNHAVTIVGWDDTYKKNNFNSASAVENNGAWIVKNSYGSDWGKEGYFYLSYEDTSISNLVCNTTTTHPDYINNYFYDGATTVGKITYTANDTGAYIPYYISNVFKATAGNGNDEELGEIVTAVAQDNTEFQVQIYTNLNDPSDPTSGTPAYSEPATYTQPFAGIHTIKLTDPVKIPANSLYSVVLKLVDSGQYYYVEKSISAGWFTATAGLNANQSFASTNGKTWKDTSQSTTPYCFSIKAHTKTIIPPAPTATPTPTPTATPAPVTYQLSYDANSSLTTGNLPASVSAVSGQTVTAGAAPYCTSRFFTGWNTQADGKGTSYSPGQSISLTQNTTLYAQWCYGYVSPAKLRYRVTGRQTVTCYGTTNSKIRSVNIPATVTYRGITYKVTTVWASAFKNKTKLTSVSIGNNVSIIGNNAFYKCKNLKKVTIGTGLTRINTNAFRGVKAGCVITIKSQKLKTVTSKIDSSVKKMTVRVPRKKYSAYRKLLRKKSKSVIIKKY